MERLKEIQTPFCVADADFPDFKHEDGNLTLSFIDYQEKHIEVYFPDVLAFKWQMIEELRDDEYYDRSYEIENSKWLKAHKDQRVIEEKEEYTHYKFNFNACGCLEVLSMEFRMVNKNE